MVEQTLRPDNPPGTEDIGFRVRLPKDGEILGLVTGLMGGSRMMVACKDGKDRMCRVPGKIKKKIWVKEGDVVIIVPWEIEKDTKGDVIWRYTKIQAEVLRRKGIIN
ncbi:Translation initiation factor 1A [Candidatus Gugararchaeum adminiculabundum]|nr:Translation initiation factor 1A [Candidatus Gugararchaeum adminiculabundum]